MAGIEFDYQKAMQHAKEAENIASELRKVVNSQIGPATQALTTSWKGQAAQRFTGRVEQTMADIIREATKLEELSQQIKSVANMMKQAELQAANTQKRYT